MKEFFTESSIAMLMIVYFLFLLIIPVITYSDGYSNGFNEGYQKALIDFHQKDKE